MSMYAVKNDEGQWLSLDSARMGIWYSNNPTLFNDKSYAEAQSVGRKAQVVTLIEEHKVKLPREVGEELDDYKRGFEHDIDVLDLLTDMDYSSELLKAHKWLYNSDGDRSEHANRLIDAYRYGWEAETEAKWYVQTPKEWWEKPDAPEYIILDQIGIVSGVVGKKLAGKFTRAELKRYHLDSDIFTLVPVEEEK